MLENDNVMHKSDTEEKNDASAGGCNSQWGAQ